MTRFVLMAVLALGVMTCAENKAATEKCKDEKSDSDACQECCNENGASGYKYINGSCACLGGG